MNHRPCAARNNHFGTWKRIKKPFPYGWFFNYYQLENEGCVYFDRVNKLDRLFDWICNKL